jgi:aspartate/methionine/tyrosine aminotransferase
MRSYLISVKREMVYSCQLHFGVSIIQLICLAHATYHLLICADGFDWLLKVRSGVEPVQVSVSSFSDTFSTAIIPALENAFSNSDRPIKAVLFTNPHNPFGQCYPTSVIQDIIRFCHDKNIHFISDEIYALSKFEVADGERLVPFVSALELDIEEIGCDLSRVHTIWSISKDLGSSGLRMVRRLNVHYRFIINENQGCCVTQGNRRLATGLALAANTQMSSLTAIAATSLLNSPQLPGLLALNATRLAYAYTRMTSFLKEHDFRYIPTTMGPYIFVKLAPKAETWDDEAAAVKSCKDAGVSVSAGRSYHVIESEKGWARLTFAIDPKKLDIALGRLAIGLNVTKPRDGIAVHGAI